jgi:hypothetical protein
MAATYIVMLQNITQPTSTSYLARCKGDSKGQSVKLLPPLDTHLAWQARKQWRPHWSFHHQSLINRIHAPELCMNLNSL